MRDQPFTLLLHIALVIIVAGALTTHFCGTEGTLTLYAGHGSTDLFHKESGPGKGRLPFFIGLDKAETEYYPDSGMAKDFKSTLSIEGKKIEVAMNDPGQYAGWRFIQSDIGPDYSILIVSHDPWGLWVTYIGYILLGIGMVGYFFQRQSSWKSVLKDFSGRKNYILATAIAITGGMLYALRFISRPPVPVLDSPLLAVHVSILITAYLLLIQSAIIAALALLTESVKYRSYLTKLNYLILFPGVFLLGAGIFIGAVWANQTWGRYWGWDPKETCALVMWLGYALPLHRGICHHRLFRNDKVFNIYLLVAVISVAFTYFGANYLLKGLHSYA